MIDLINNTAGVTNQTILEWQVWFYVAPLGLYKLRTEAVAAAKNLDMNPLLCVVPVPVAITQCEVEISQR